MSDTEKKHVAGKQCDENTARIRKKLNTNPVGFKKERYKGDETEYNIMTYIIVVFVL